MFVITLELNIVVLRFDEFPSANHQHRTVYILCRNCRKVGLVVITKKEKMTPEKKGVRFQTASKLTLICFVGTYPKKRKKN